MEKITTNIDVKEFYKRFKETNPWAEDNPTEFVDHLIRLGLEKYGRVA